MIRSKRLPLYVACGAGLSALAAVFGLTLSQSGSSAAGVSAAPSSTVVQTRGTNLGQILVDAQGRTMYLFAKDIGPASTCVGACTSAWPPVPVSAAPHAAGGASPSALGVIGSGSSRQLSLRRAPAVLLRRRQQGRPNQRSGPRRVRRQMVRPELSRSRDRQRAKQRRQWQRRVRLLTGGLDREGQVMTWAHDSPIGLAGRIVCIAHSNDPLPVGAAVIVFATLGPGTLVVFPWADPLDNILHLK